MVSPFDHQPEDSCDSIIACESCSNYIYVAQVEPDQVFPCPICGALNKYVQPPKEALNGRMVLTSPKMEINRTSIEEGTVTLPQLPESVQQALLWLQKNKWTFGFKVERNQQ